MKKTILIIFIVIVIAFIAVYFMYKDGCLTGDRQTDKREVFKTQEECEETTGKNCVAGMCDYKCGLGGAWKGWVSTEEKTEDAFSFEEALQIAQANRDCSMAGILTDDHMYNEATKTWWIDLERMPELEKDGCNPACVVSEENKKAEVNWRCTGLRPEERGGEVECVEEQRGADVCIEIYSPVCAKVNVLCKDGAPCPPVNETFSNSCYACKNSLVESYVPGECKNK